MISNTDLPPEHSSLGALLKKIGINSSLIVERCLDYPTSQCYWNVQQHIILHGGELVFGWMLFEVKNAYIWAYHHGIWRAPDGKLIDLTAHPEGLQGQTHFAIDERDAPDLSSPPGIVPIYQITVEDPVIDAFICADLAVRNLRRAKQAEMRGNVSLQFSAAASGFTGPPEIIADLNRRYDGLIEKSAKLCHSFIPYLAKRHMEG